MDKKPSFTELCEQFHVAMLTTTAETGALHSRPMAIARATESGTLFFVSRSESGVVDEAQTSRQCAVTMQSQGAYLSISGSSAIRYSRALKDDLWSSALDAWFPDGVEDPNVVVIEVTGQSAAYWTTSLAQGVRYAFEVAKSMVTGDAVDARDIGDHGTLQLGPS